MLKHTPTISAGSTAPQRILSILLVSDGWKAPLSFRYSMRTVRTALWSVGFLALLVCVGAVSYWQMSRQLADYETLKSRSDQVERDRRSLTGLAEKFNQLVYQEQRIQQLFGMTVVVPGDQEHVESDPEAMVTQTMHPPVNHITISLPGPKGFSEDKGGLSNLPSFLPVEGFITRGFEPEAANQPHQGIDIAAEEGASIRSVAGGVVIFANWTPDNGWTLILDHGNGFLSYYKHNQSLLVSEQQYIARGTVVALLGNSGTASTGPHLHFELWKDGQAVDPRHYLLNF